VKLNLAEAQGPPQDLLSQFPGLLAVRGSNQELPNEGVGSSRNTSCHTDGLGSSRSTLNKRRLPVLLASTELSIDLL
jgi:hypothetical protein